MPVLWVFMNLRDSLETWTPLQAGEAARDWPAGPEVAVGGAGHGFGVKSAGQGFGLSVR